MGDAEAPPPSKPGTVAAEFSAGRYVAFLLLGILAGAPYALIYNSDVAHMLRGAAAGALISTGISIFELIVLPGRLGRRLQDSPFGLYLALRAGAWTVLIVLGLVIAQTLIPLGEELRLAKPQMLADIAFSFVISFVAILAFSIQRLLGAEVVAALLSGRYYRPRTEPRVFLLLDMVGSTALADRFGDGVYLGVLNRLLREVTPVILGWGGEIHRYVGDAVIVTWPPRLGAARATTAAIACALGCVRRIGHEAAGFTEEFGTAPGLRAAIHLGPVVAAEIGTVKREIAFLGDTMNTLARIEQAGRETRRSVVLSGDALAAATLPRGMTAEKLGDFTPRGKHGLMRLYAIEATPSPACGRG